MTNTQSRPQSELAFDPQQLLLCFIMALIVGISEISVCLSLAILVFGDRLTSYVPTGFGLLLLSGVIANSVVALRSSSSNIVAVPQDVPIAIFTVITATLIAQFPPETTQEELWLTVSTTIVLITFLTALFCGGLGLLKFGNLTRFIPYPVIGGFLGGSGWLLFKGGLGMMSGIALTGSNLLELFDPDILRLWLSGAAFSLLLLWLTRRYDHWLIIPGSLMAVFGLFYFIIFMTHTPLDLAREQGWLLETLSDNVEVHLFNPLAFSQANWPLILGQSGNIISIIVLSAIALLLNASAIELATKRDIDLNQELRVVGLANLLTSFAGGFVSYHQLNYSILAEKLTINSRLVGCFAALAYGVALFLGSSIISIFPKPVLGGLLLFLGLDLLSQWLYSSWFKLPKTDYISVVIILVVIGTMGFLPGVGVGLVVTIILFVINYSRINVAKHTFSGATCQSNVARSPEKALILQEQGEKIYILVLEGFIFFGTANNLIDKIQQRINNQSQQTLQFLVLDFRLVRGIDSSAVLSFIKIEQLAEKYSLTLVFTHLSDEVKDSLQKGDCLARTDDKIFPDLDRGLEWCEEQLLQSISEVSIQTLTLEQQLKELFLENQQVSEFINYLKVWEVPEQQIIFNQGDRSDGLYFLESGQISVFLNLSNGQTKRLRTYNSGTIIGEMGLYQQANRSATVIADRNSKLYYLSNQAFQKMEQENSNLASIFHRFIVTLLAERLRYQETEIRNLLE